MRNRHDDSPPRSGHDRLAARALDALGEQCRIPVDLEERILARVLDGGPPVEEPAPAPLHNVIRLGREEGRRWRWIGRAGAAAAALLVAAVVILTPRGAPPRGGRPVAGLRMPLLAPRGLRGTEIPGGHPRLVEARQALFAVAGHVARECRAPDWSTLVRFERTGAATVLDVASGEAAVTGCIERAVAEARVRSSSGPRLAVQYEHSASRTRISGWLLDET